MRSDLEPTGTQTVVTVAGDGFSADDWLSAFASPATRDAYARDARGWLAWCTERGVDPRQARRPDADAWAADLRDAGLAPRTIARRLAACSSLYAYLLDAERVERNPFARVRRPKASAAGHAETPALADDEAARLLAVASCPPESPRTRASVALLLTLGLRVSELLALDVTDLGTDRGHRVVTVTRKGGQRQRLPLAGPVAHDLDRYLDGRTTGPLIATSTGARMDRRAMHRLIRRLAVAAQVDPGAVEHIGPHALRRTAATMLLDAGVTLRDVQAILGHADPRTTAGYDRGRKGLARQSHAVSGLAASLYAEG